MFLALTDSGRDGDLTAIAKSLLRVLRRHLGHAPEARQAIHYWKNGLTDPDSNKPNKELADRVYLVLHYAVDAFKKHPNPIGRHGDVVVCNAIRARVPLSPGGFRKVGKIEGSSSDPTDSTRIVPNRTFLSLIGRSAPEVVGEVLPPG